MIPEMLYPKKRGIFTSFCRASSKNIGILAVFVVGMVSVSAEYKYDGADGTNVLLGGGGFTGASGESLTVGATNNASGSYNAVVQGLNAGGGNASPHAEIRVLGSSSVMFKGRDIASDMTQQVVLNFEDQSKLLLGGQIERGSNRTRGHVFGRNVIINYNSSADSINNNLPFKFQTDSDDPDSPTTLNVNAGSILVGGLDFNGTGLVNLAGGDLSVKLIGLCGRRSQGTINFDSSAGSTLTIINADSADYLAQRLKTGLLTLQIDGIVQKELNSFEISYSVPDGSMTVQAVGVNQIDIPELSTSSLLKGLLLLACFRLVYCALKRRRL